MGSVRFGSFRVQVISGHSGSGQIGSIRVIFGSGLDRINKIRVGSVSDWVISDFGLIRVNTTSGRFGSGSVLPGLSKTLKII